MRKAPEIKINVFRAPDGEWFAARWIDGNYDGCDSLEIPASSSDEEAMQAARDTALTVSGPRSVARVEDI